MARRTVATIRRPTPHRYVDDRGSCAVCGLLAANDRHAPDAVAEVEQRTAATAAAAAEIDRRRTGDTES